MPINTNIFQPLPQARLEVIAKAANTLEEGHLKTIEAASKLKEAYATLPLNEAEDGWKAQKIAEIQQTVDENSKYGNAYYALDDIIRKSGDIKSDPGLIGRLKAQEEYKKFINQIDANKNIGADTKEFLKAENPYVAVTDKYNDKGEVIGTSTWKPSREIYDDVNWDDLVVKAIGLIHPEQSQNSYNTYLYIDADGKEVIKPDYKSEYGTLIGTYNTITNQRTTLDKDRLFNAVIGMIGLNPNNYGAINQEIEVAKHFKYDTVYKDDKTTKTRDEYVKDKLSGLLDAVSYENNAQTSKQDDTTIKEINKLRAKQNNFGIGNAGSILSSSSPYSTTGLQFEVSSNVLASEKLKSEDYKIAINDGLKNEKLANVADSIKTSINAGNYKDAIDAINKASEGANEKDKPWFEDMKYVVQQYAVSKGEYDSLKETLNSEQEAYVNLKSLIDLKEDLNVEKLGGTKEAEELLTQVANLYDKVFSENDKIYYDPYTTEQSTKIKSILANENIPYTIEDGKIVLSKENKRYVLDFVNIIKNSEQSVSGIKRFFRNRGFNRIYNTHNLKTKDIGTVSDVLSYQYVSKIQDIYNEASEIQSQVGNTYVAPGNIILGSTIEEQFVTNAIKQGISESDARNMMKEQFKMMNGLTERKILGQYEAMANGNVQVYAEDIGVEEGPKWISLGDPKYEKDLTGIKTALQTASNSECSTLLHITPDGRLIKGVNVKLTYSDGTKNETKYFNLLLNDYDTEGLDVLSAINGSSVTALNGKLEGLKYTGNGNAYSNIFSVIDNDNNISLINAKYAGNEKYYLTDEKGEQISGFLDKEQIKEFYAFNNTINILKAQNKLNMFDKNPNKYGEAVVKVVGDFVDKAVELGMNSEWAAIYGMNLFGIHYGRS